MAPKKIDWETTRAELKRRWPLLAVLGAYILAGLFFAVLIYGFKWDQSATRLAARVFPLPAAQVNGDYIWLSSYYRRLAIFEHYAKRVEAEQPELLPEDPDERREKTLDQLIDIALLKQEARKNGIRVTDQEIEETFQKIVEQNGGRENFEKVLAEFYGITPYDFQQEFIPEQLYQEKLQNQLFTRVHARHILVGDEAQAREILGKLANGEDFNELAKTYSQDLATRESGGDLGFIRRAQVVPAFGDAAFSLKEGETAQAPVQTEFGWHIIKIDERQEGPIGDRSFVDWFDEVRAQAKIRRYVAKPPAIEDVPADATTEESVPPTDIPATEPAPAQ